MKHCGTQELETGRLLLRRLTMDDSEMMFNNWASDPEVTRYLRWNAHRSWGETAETLNEWEKHYDDPAFYQWGITDRHTGVLFGSISLFPAPALKTGWHLNTERLGPAWEVGYALGRKWWNNGYMTEALCAVRDYWFNTVDAPWLAAMQLRHSVPCGTTGLTRWAPTGWPPSTPMRTLPAAPCCKRQALSTTTM